MMHVVQMTDTHLFADPGGRLYDINTRDSLRAVIAHAQRNVPSIDLLLVTGDLVHDETEAGYRVLNDMFRSLHTPAYYLPGNHDDSDMMQRVLTNVTRGGLTYYEHPQWLVILLDSSIRGRVEGKLERATLDKLAQLLGGNGHKHVLIALHHHVIDIQSTWLDALNLRNSNDFLTLLNDFPSVRVVVNGHIHQELDEQRDRIRFLGSPATCFQFSAKQTDAGIADLPPGYRHIVLHENGDIDTTVHYVDME